jgi:hypothetical protein
MIEFSQAFKDYAMVGWNMLGGGISWIGLLCFVGFLVSGIIVLIQTLYKAIIN